MFRAAFAKTFGLIRCHEGQLCHSGHLVSWQATQQLVDAAIPSEAMKRVVRLTMGVRTESPWVIDAVRMTRSACEGNTFRLQAREAAAAASLVSA